MSSTTDATPSAVKGPRRRHNKVRTGCSTCKSRKIKCDEQRPRCRNCVKHNAECHFAQSRNGISTSAHPPLSSVGSPFQHEVDQHGGFSMVDLEMLHHYTTSTALTLSTDPAMRNFWRLNIPKVGFSSPFVLHSAMSLAALHTARFKPSQEARYVNLGLAYHNKASEKMRSISDVTEENYSALYAFSMLTMHFAFAKPRNTNNLLLVDDGVMPDWLSLFRGVRSLSQMRSAHRDHQFEVLLQNGMRVNRIWEAQSETHMPALNELLDKITINVHESLKLEGLREALVNLQKTYACFMSEESRSEEDKRQVVFIWIYKLPESFVELLRQDDAEALCLLAFFCVVLHRLDYLWWIEGWAKHLIGRIWSTLDPGHRLWCQWPVEEIGWVQPED